MFKKTIKVITSLILIFGIVLGSIFFYVKGHKEKVVNFIVDTIAEKHNGTVSFDDVTLRSWGNITNPAFRIKNIVLLDSTEYKTTRFQAENIYLNLSVKSLFKKKIQLKSIRIENANYSSIIIKEDLDTLAPQKNQPSEEHVVPEVFKPYKMSFDIENISFDIKNIPRHKRFIFKINTITSNFLVGPDRIASSLDLNANISQLGFNIKKGSYLKNSTIEATMHPEINLIENKIHIPSFDLSINNQISQVTADFDTSSEPSFAFKFVNKETEFASTVSLLSEHIQLKLNKYKFDRPFSTQTILKGSFAPFSNPLVHVEFHSDENSALINERFELENLSFLGSFTNRIYDDERAETEDKRNIKLKLNAITGNYKETTFEVANGILTSTPEDKALIKGMLKANGVPKDLISLTNNPLFTLNKGHYNVIAHLEGDATSATNLLTHSNISLKVENTEIFDTENKLSIPVKQLNINLKENRAALEVLELPLNASDDLKIYGSVSNFSSILSKDSEHLASTNLRLKSKKLRWSDFASVFRNPNKGPEVNDKHPGLVLHDLARDLYLKFNPNITVDIKQLQFKSFLFTNLSTGIEFSDVNHLHFKDIAFELKERPIQINASLNFEQTQQIIIDAEVDARGTPEILNDIFKSDTFFFKGGDFDLQGQVYGDLLQMNDFLNALNGRLKLTNSSVLYQPNNLIVPIDLLDLEIKNNLAILNTLEIGAGTSDRLKFSGRLENFSAFLSPTNTNQVNTFINLYSKRLQWDDFIDIFHKEAKKENTGTKSKNNNHLKETLRGVHASFNPKLTVVIDKFEYKDLMVVEHFSTGLYFDNLDNLVLEDCGFDYNTGSKVAFAARVDISESSGTNVDADFKVYGDPLHLNEILKYDTFLFQGGQIEIAAKITGDIEQMNALLSSSSAKFKIENSAFIHKPSQVRIPFNILEIDIKNDDAILKSLNIDLPSGDNIAFSGEIKHMTSILRENNTNNERLSTKLNIYSNKVRLSEFIDLFAQSDTEKKKNNSNQHHALKAVAKDVYHKYQPELSINFNEFIFNNLTLNNFKTGFYFENENLLYLENTAFNFYNGKMTLDAHLDITDPHETEFSLGITTDRIDFDKLLVSFDYFDIPSIKEAQKIDGKISINSQLEGKLIDSIGVLPASLRGTIDFNLQEMEIKGFDPIMKVGNIVFKKKRLEDIRFGPIENVLYFANNTVEFPLMEIQSTAFDFYVAGHLGYGDAKTNLWTAIPLSNFKRRDVTNIPGKKKYIEAGNKIYIEAKNNKKNEIKYKLHLSDKKYFKERDSLSEYKQLLKENRLLRREYKRDSRMIKKSAKLDSRKLN